MRGKRKFASSFSRFNRLILAGAGKTPLDRDTAAAAHPRRCGENFLIPAIAASAIGSSPQVRGKHRLDGLYSHSLRLIPAGAGKTAASLSTLPALPAHPRRCGENFYTARVALCELGSSPQVRGKLTGTSKRYPYQGSSPQVRGKRN